MLEPYDGEINEFYIDVAVKNPKVEDSSYVSYEIVIETNNISFNEKKSATRRRYSEFVLLRKLLVKEFPTWKLPPLPPKYPFTKDHFQPAFIEERRKGLEEFVKMLVSQNIFLSSKALHLFLQSSHSLSEIKDTIQSKNVSIESQQNGVLSQGFPNLDTTNQFPDEIGTLLLSSQTDVNVNASSFPPNDSSVPATIPTTCDNSTAESKRVSFCEQVTVAQIYTE